MNSQCVDCGSEALKPRTERRSPMQNEAVGLMKVRKLSMEKHAQPTQMISNTPKGTTEWISSSNAIPSRVEATMRAWIVLAMRVTVLAQFPGVI